MRSVRGFTLIELMITVAIIAIIAIIATPSFSIMLAKQRVNSETKNLMSILSQARTQAAFLRQETTVQINQIGTNTTTTFYVPFNRSVELSPTSNLNSITFSSAGLVKNFSNLSTSNSLSIKLCDSRANYSKTITISFLGTLREGSIVGGCT